MILVQHFFYTAGRVRFSTSGDRIRIWIRPAQTIERLGYPDYVRVLLGIGTIVGAVALVVPRPRSLKGWVYAGFTFDCAAAVISHLMVGDPASSLVMPVVAFAVLMASYAGYHRYVLAEEA